MTPLKAIAGISAPDSRSVVVQPYDTGAMAAIEKAIMKSDLGITPSNDGRIIRINIPALTAVSRACRAQGDWTGLHGLWSWVPPNIFRLIQIGSHISYDRETR